MANLHKDAKEGIKGVAIPYIIALILAVAVIAVMGYWFFVMGGRFGGETTTSECKTKQTLFCQQWSVKCYADIEEPVFEETTACFVLSADDCLSKLGVTTPNYCSE